MKACLLLYQRMWRSMLLLLVVVAVVVLLWLKKTNQILAHPEDD
jgi:uncharacterized membrane-anchored protein